MDVCLGGRLWDDPVLVLSCTWRGLHLCAARTLGESRSSVHCVGFVTRVFVVRN